MLPKRLQGKVKKNFFFAIKDNIMLNQIKHENSYLY